MPKLGHIGMLQWSGGGGGDGVSILGRGAPNQATTGTAEEVLATISIPANVVLDGGTIRVLFVGHTAANANLKTFRIRVGGLTGTVALSSGAVAMNNQTVGTIVFFITRKSASTATTHGPFAAAPEGVAQVATVGIQNMQRSIAVDWTVSNLLVITATTPTAAGDATLDTYIVELIQ